MSRINAKENERLLTYALYCMQIDSIKHFDNLQTSYRIMSSRLLLATFAAIGFIFSLETKELPINRLPAVMIICFIALGAITILWHLDLTFIERLSMSMFADSLNLEKKFSWLPQAHHNMLYEGSRAISPEKKVNFYIGSSFTIIVPLGIVATIYGQTFYTWMWIPVLVSVCFLMLAYAKVLKKMSMSYKELLNLIELTQNGK